MLKNYVCHFMHNIFFRLIFLNLAQEMHERQWPRILYCDWRQGFSESSLRIAPLVVHFHIDVVKIYLNAYEHHRKCYVFKKHPVSVHAQRIFSIQMFQPSSGNAGGAMAQDSGWRVEPVVDTGEFVSGQDSVNQGSGL